MRLLWFVSNANHFEAPKAYQPSGLADAQSCHHKSQDRWSPSCDCIEFKVDLVDESLLRDAAEDARLIICWLGISILSLRYSIWIDLIQQEVIDELAAAFGLGQQVSAITERAMRGELDFVTSFTERLSLLRGLAQSELDVVAQHLALMPGADGLAATSGRRGPSGNCFWWIFILCRTGW